MMYLKIKEKFKEIDRSNLNDLTKLKKKKY